MESVGKNFREGGTGSEPCRLNSGKARFHYSFLLGFSFSVFCLFFFLVF